MAVFGKSTGSNKGKPTYAYSIIVVAFVLFLLGFLSWLFTGLVSKSDKLKEDLAISAYLIPSVTDADAEILKTEISNIPGVLEAKYCNKDCALAIWEKEYDSSWRQFMDGENPLEASIDIKVQASKMQKDSLKILESFILSNHGGQVYEVVSRTETLDDLIKWGRIIGLALIFIFILLAIYAFLSIDSTIRLAMYSNRFLIKTMQMVGATRGFIGKPIIIRAIINGLIAASVGTIMFLGAKGLLQTLIPQMRPWTTYNTLLWIILIMFVFGVLISWYSTHRSILKYLKLKLDDLY